MPARKLPAKGSIREVQKASGKKFEAVIDLVPDPKTGKRRQKTKLCDTRKEAQLWLNQTRVEVDNGTVVVSDRITLGALIETFLEHRKQHEVRGTTLNHYHEVARTLLGDKLADIQVQKIEPHDLQAHYSYLLTDGRKDGKGGLSIQRVRALNQIISAALDYAVDNGTLNRNPATKVKLPRPPKRKATIWQPDEAGVFLEYTKDHTRAVLFRLALTAGMRRGELFGLRWSDCDLDNGVIRIRQEVVRKGGRRVTQDPKTEAGKRTIDLGPQMIAALKEQRIRVKEMQLAATAWADHDLVFPSAVGTPICPDNLSSQFRELARRAGTPKIRLHDTRHSSASIGLANGEGMHEVSARLGHADVETTMGIYAEVLKGQHKKRATVLEGVLFKGVPGKM